MEYNPKKREIILNRKFNELDKFVSDFVEVLGRHSDYVIVSGYVSILFGRSRATEDIDLLVPRLNIKSFTSLWDDLKSNGFLCLNTSILSEAFNFLEDFAIRFSKRSPIPNIEFKIIKNDLDKYSFDNKIKVITKNGKFNISPLEMQIAYKLFLGSDKDLEDAKFLYELFKEKLNNDELLYFVNKLGVHKNFEEIKDEKRRDKN